MLDLSQVGIRVAVIHQRVEIVRHVPDALFAASEAGILVLLARNEIECLVGMVLAIELRNRGIGILLVIAEFFFRFALAITGGDEIVPFVQVFHGRGFQ